MSHKQINMPACYMTS